MIAVILAKAAWLVPVVAYTFIALMAACTGHWLRNYFHDIKHDERMGFLSNP